MIGRTFSQQFSPARVKKKKLPTRFINYVCCWLAAVVDPCIDVVGQTSLASKRRRKDWSECMALRNPRRYRESHALGVNARMLRPDV